MNKFFFFFFNDTATTEIYTLSLHDALPIWPRPCNARPRPATPGSARMHGPGPAQPAGPAAFRHVGLFINTDSSIPTCWPARAQREPAVCPDSPPASAASPRVPSPRPPPGRTASPATQAETCHRALLGLAHRRSWGQLSLNDLL